MSRNITCIECTATKEWGDYGNFYEDDYYHTVKPCVFPFTYQGVEYNGCLNDEDRGFWCPFETPFVETESAKNWNYGLCDVEGCPEHQDVVESEFSSFHFIY